LAIVAAALAAFAACDGTSNTDGNNLQTVVLREWAVTKSLLEVPTGNLRFRVRNNGTLEHELVIIKSVLPADNLPIDQAGTAVDLGAAGEVAGEIEAIGSNQEKSATFSLTSGKYVLICNIAGHYQQGMRTDFTVQ
jgi:uncharacterized cupredoxin-like copper-binding protein